MYISRNYLREKWGILKTAIEDVLDIYNEEEDEVDEKMADTYLYEIKTMMMSILKELGDQSTTN